MKTEVVLLKYTKDQLESNRKYLSDLLEQKKEVEDKISETSIVVEHLEKEVRDMESVRETPIFEGEANAQKVLEAIQSFGNSRGIMIKEIQEILDKQDSGISYKAIERHVERLVKSGKVVQANPEALRYKKYKVPQPNLDEILQAIEA